MSAFGESGHMMRFQHLHCIYGHVHEVFTLQILPIAVVASLLPSVTIAASRDRRGATSCTRRSVLINRRSVAHTALCLCGLLDRFLSSMGYLIYNPSNAISAAFRLPQRR